MGCWCPLCSLVPAGGSFGASWILPPPPLQHCRSQMLCFSLIQGRNLPPSPLQHPESLSDLHLWGAETLLLVLPAEGS